MKAIIKQHNRWMDTIVCVASILVTASRKKSDQMKQQCMTVRQISLGVSCKTFVALPHQTYVTAPKVAKTNITV